MATPPLFAIVMAGGSGTRFWPASREARPKQFLPVAGGRSMIAATVERLGALVELERVIVVTAESQVALVHEALPGLPRENVLAEPCAKNTAPCVALAALEVDRRSPGAVQIVVPADHVIEPTSAFLATLSAGIEEASASQALITFGIRPTFPATGYGYIEVGAAERERGGIPVHAVARFVEKPALERAREFLASGRFLWNSGMFVWRTAAILAAYRAHLPAVLEALEGPPRGAALARAYGRLPSIPVDVAILEQAPNVRVLPIDYRWSDVGSWAALPEVVAQDTQGNFPVLAPGGRLVGEDARGCVVWSEAPELVALVGVRDLVVVRAGTTTLVCARERAQDVKKIVERLRAEGSDAV